MEMVNSVDDLKSTRSIQVNHFLDLEMLDVKIPSALKKIIQNSYLKKKVRIEGQKVQDRFLRGRQIAFMINECFRVTGTHYTVLDYAIVMQSYSSQR